jgi:hypothetical protein
VCVCVCVCVCVFVCMYVCMYIYTYIYVYIYIYVHDMNHAYMDTHAQRHIHIHTIPSSSHIQASKTGTTPPTIHTTSKHMHTNMTHTGIENWDNTFNRLTLGAPAATTTPLSTPSRLSQPLQDKALSASRLTLSITKHSGLASSQLPGRDMMTPGSLKQAIEAGTVETPPGTLLRADFVRDDRFNPPTKGVSVPTSLERKLHGGDDDHVLPHKAHVGTAANPRLTAAKHYGTEAHSVSVLGARENGIRDSGTRENGIRDSGTRENEIRDFGDRQNGIQDVGARENSDGGRNAGVLSGQNLAGKLGGGRSLWGDGDLGRSKPEWLLVDDKTDKTDKTEDEWVSFKKGSLDDDDDDNDDDDDVDDDDDSEFVVKRHQAAFDQPTHLSNQGGDSMVKRQHESDSAQNAENKLSANLARKQAASPAMQTTERAKMRLVERGAEMWEKRKRQMALEAQAEAAAAQGRVGTSDEHNGGSSLVSGKGSLGKHSNAVAHDQNIVPGRKPPQASVAAAATTTTTAAAARDDAEAELAGNQHVSGGNSAGQTEAAAGDHVRMGLDRISQMISAMQVCVCMGLCA